MTGASPVKDPEWQATLKYLRRRFAAECGGRALPKVIQTFLTTLAKTARGRLLGACLAIDLASQALTPREIIQILEYMGECKHDPCLRLAAVLREHPNHANWICASRLKCDEPL